MDDRAFAPLVEALRLYKNRSLDVSDAGTRLALDTLVEGRPELDAETEGMALETEPQFEAVEDTIDSAADLICLSHLRWNFVWQRPQHLMSRFARRRRVFFFEEPIFDSPIATLDMTMRGGVCVAVPHLPQGTSADDVQRALEALLKDMIDQCRIREFVLWYYTPMALEFSRDLEPLGVVYDCMDELTGFRGASPKLKSLERELLSLADIVFTGGRSLYEAKKHLHHSVHALPSSIDAEHFARSRAHAGDPADQSDIPYPRLGYFGVIDERLDMDLLDALAVSRPDWQWIMVGPVVKIDPSTLPRHPNIHYLGAKRYEELPDYIGGWDVALLPFALSEATRFISPTKTPEYLAAGKPVVSTPVPDVVDPWGSNDLVKIAVTVDEFIAAAEHLLAQHPGESWLERVDSVLAGMSWDRTWARMAELMDRAVESRAGQRARERARRQSERRLPSRRPVGLDEDAPQPRWAKGK